MLQKQTFVHFNGVLCGKPTKSRVLKRIGMKMIYDF